MWTIIDKDTNSNKLNINKKVVIKMFKSFSSAFRYQEKMNEKEGRKKYLARPLDLYLEEEK